MQISSANPHEYCCEHVSRNHAEKSPPLASHVISGVPKANAQKLWTRRARAKKERKKRKQISKASSFCGFLRRGSFDQNASNATRQLQRQNADTINSLIIISSCVKCVIIIFILLFHFIFFLFILLLLGCRCCCDDVEKLLNEQGEKRKRKERAMWIFFPFIDFSFAC